MIVCRFSATDQQGEINPGVDVMIAKRKDLASLEELILGIGLR